MADLFQGSQLPSTTTTAETQQVAPEFYTNYLQDIANLGQNAVTQGGVAGSSALQQQAYQMAPQVAFSGAGSLGNASQLIGQAGTTTAPDVVGNYMNPYTKYVVDEMGRLAQRNVQENVLPGLTGAAVGTGQFGSKRQYQATGNTLRDIQADLLGKQAQALQTGYQNATTAAQTDLSRALSAGQGFTQLGQEQSQLGIGGLNELSKLGGEQQATEQNILNYPMTQAQQFAKLLQGYSVPTGTVTQTTAPGTQGQFSNSPLSQIAGLASLIQAIYGTNSNTPTGLTDAQIANQNAQASYYNNLAGKKKDGGSIGYADGGEVAEPIAYHDEYGNLYDVNGNLVE